LEIDSEKVETTRYSIKEM